MAHLHDLPPDETNIAFVANLIRGRGGMRLKCITITESRGLHLADVRKLEKFVDGHC